MRKKMSIMLVTVFLLTVAISSLTIPIYSSDVQPVGEGKRGGLLDQHKSLQAYSFSEPPETEWNKTYGGPLDDWGEAVIETSDGGYALTGYTQSFGAGALDFWLVKADSSGNMQWNRTYGGASGDGAYSVVETSDGGYALTGWTYSFGAGQHDLWLVKVDSSGNVQWNKTYGGPNEDVARSIVRTSDGGYAIAGHTDSFGAGGWDFWLVKVDSSGNMQWNRTYGGIYCEGADCVVETSDGGYALLGYTESFGAGLTDFWLVKADSSGNMQWNRTYGGSLWDHGMSVVETSDGGYAMAGHIESSSGADFWLIKVDADGNTQWNKTYNQTDSDFAYSVVETSDGGYALGGFISVASGDFWLVKVDSSGNVQWNKTCGGAGADYAYSLVETSDGGYALAGKTDSFGAGQNDFWLVKVAPEEVGVDWWPMFHHDPSHTGYSTSTAPNTNYVLWTYATGGYVWSSPAVVDGKVYVGSDDYNVYCLNASTGAKIWSYTTGRYVWSSPAVVDGKVYVGQSYDHEVYCLNATNGAHIWNYTTGGEVRSCPAVADDKVYVGSGDYNVYCLNASTGAKIWSYTTGKYVYSSPAVVDGKVYVGSYDDHKLYCLNATTGAKIWSYTTGKYVYSSPAVADDKVYVGSWDKKVYCLNAANGDFIWSYTTGGAVVSCPAVADGKVYVGGSADHKVYCLNATNGAHIWNYTTGSDVFSSPAVADGKVYIGSHDNELYCLNASTGAKIWNYTTGGGNSCPAVADGKVYVGSGYGKVYAFGPPLPLPRVHNLDTHEDFATIQAAINDPDTADGHTIFVEEGTYYEHVVVSKSLSLIGEDRSTTIIDGITGTVMNVTANNVNITGFTIQSRAGTSDNLGIYVGEWSTGNNISYNIITNNGYGIRLEYSSNYNIISGNDITNNDYGIHLHNSSSNIISGNDITGNGKDGIHLYKSSNYNIISGNKITANKHDCISLYYSSYNSIIRNKITDNCAGIFLSDSSNNSISENNIANNEYGIRLVNASDNSIFHNDFINNTNQAYIEPEYPSINTWDDGYPSGGNYWSDQYHGPCADHYSGPYQNETGSDGICDTPYTIDVDNQDQYPLMNPHANQHNVAVTNVTPSKTVVCQGYSMSVNVTVENQGNYTETFNVTAYYNSNVINYTTVTNLPPGEETTVTFTWNTTGVAKGNYTIKAIADTVLDETDTDDNTKVDDWVIVSMVGDLTGPDGWPDGKCDMRDIRKVAKLFGVNYPDPNYEPNCDVTGPTAGVPDGKIDMRDIRGVAKHFGEIDP